MKTHDLIQGTPAWLAYRASMRNASDAPAMLGCSPYKTRAELLRELHTGLPAEVDIGTQMRFDNGHRAEALARPLAEEIVGEDLYPCVGSKGRLSASFDGLTLDERICFEHKALNDALRACFGGCDDIDGRDLPLHHRAQMEQQLLVSGAERVLFMSSRWDADGNLIEERHCWYYPDAELRQSIVDGWLQFERDLAAYVPPPLADPVTAAPVETLPAVAVRMDGSLVVQSNLPAFGEALKLFVSRVPKAPSTDQEFADTEAACKALKRAEDALDAAEANALASLADVNAMQRMVSEFRDLARATRLASEKMVTRRKTEVKEGAVAAARRALDQHIATLNGELAPMRLQPVPADFAGAIKGLRSISSMQDALDTTLAAGKIAADSQARVIRGNVATFKGAAEGLEFLFADLHVIVHKGPDDFAATLHSRIAQHRIAEQARESARKKAEEERIAAEARRLADEQIRQAQQAAQIAQQQALAAQQAAQAPAAAPTPAPAPTAAPERPETVKESSPVVADEPATLKLGTICERLGFVMSAAFLAGVLRVKPARVDGASRLFTESQYLLICRQLQAHVSAMAELYAGVEA